MAMKEWAIYYASLGLAVIPLKPPRIPGQKKPGKEPMTAHGVKDATTDQMLINQWWDSCPDANIGIATGSRSGGLVVIDLDIDEDRGLNGYEVLREWQQEHGEFPETWQSITGRGGYHLFYRDAARNSNRAALYDGVDIRGENGYVVAPPSVHENGRLYEWEQGPGDLQIAQVNDKVTEFMLGPLPEQKAQGFQEPETIPQGQRVSALVKLIGSQRAKGLSTEAIRAAVRAENEARCIPPLTDQELEKEVFPALKRDWKAERPYSGQTVCDRGKSRTVNAEKLNADLVDMDTAQEEEPEWLVHGYIPKYQITAMVGDGGSGKTTAWCRLVADISSGNRPFLLGQPGGLDLKEYDHQKVLFFSAEDSYKYVLRRKLRLNGANLKNIKTMDISDERFKRIKFNDPFLEQLIIAHRPALIVFDPIQAFIPENIKMGERNAMRSCTEPLIGYGEKYGCTFLLIVHTNKMAGVWGRKRMADSSDLWDISRSVLMMGETSEPGIRYISQEKSNNGPLRSTVLFSIEGGTVEYKGMSDKKDKDFVTAAAQAVKQAPARDEAKEFILDFLKDGEKPVAELDEMASALGVSKNTLGRAKTELKQENKIKMWPRGFNPKKWYMSLIQCEDVGENEEKH